MASHEQIGDLRSLLDLPSNRGAGAIADRALAVIPSAILRAEEFWSRFRTLAELPAAFAWLKEYLSTGGLGFDNDVQHRLALAFVLAMNGRRTEGELELDRWIARHRLPDTAEQRLRERFREVAANDAASETGGVKFPLSPA